MEGYHLYFGGLIEYSLPVFCGEDDEIITLSFQNRKDTAYISYGEDGKSTFNYHAAAGEPAIILVTGREQQGLYDWGGHNILE